MYKTQLDYIFCPFCGRYLEVTVEEGQELKYCSQCKWKHYLKHDIAVAGIAVRFNPLPETLMVLRNREPNPGKWSFPAGFVNFGERPDNALIREVREETGLTVVRAKLIKEVVSDDDPNRSPKQQSRFYKMVVTGKVKNQDQEENSEIKWHSLSRQIPVPEIAWGNHELLFRYMQGDVVSFMEWAEYWKSEVR